MFKTGDIILEYTPFNWKNIWTYIPACIRFFQGLYTQGLYCPYNHVAIIVKIHEQYYVFESVANGVIYRRYKDFMKDTDNKNLLYLRPKFSFDDEIVKKKALENVGKKYDYAGTLFFQLIQQITDERVDLSPKDIKKQIERFYCSEFVAYLFNQGTNGVAYKDFSNIDPEDLYESYYIDGIFEKINI